MSADCSAASGSASTGTLAPLLPSAVHPVVAPLRHFLAVSVAVYGHARGVDDSPSASSSTALAAKPKPGGAPVQRPARAVRVLHAADPATAVPTLSLAALARDYAFVRDVVVRYAHANAGGQPSAAAGSEGAAPGGGAPASVGAGGSGAAAALRESSGSEWGVSRAVVASLQERGLLDLAFFAAHVRSGRGGGARRPTRPP